MSIKSRVLCVAQSPVQREEVVFYRTTDEVSSNEEQQRLFLECGDLYPTTDK